MEIDGLISNYVLGDGQITSLKVKLSYQNRNDSEATIELIVRKSAGNNRLEKCRIKLQFSQVTEVGINDDFGSSYYSDIVLVKQEDGSFYLSLDPYGNTGQPNEDDNLVIIAKSLIIEEKE